MAITIVEINDSNIQDLGNILSEYDACDGVSVNFNFTDYKIEALTLRGIDQTTLPGFNDKVFTLPTITKEANGERIPLYLKIGCNTPPVNQRFYRFRNGDVSYVTVPDRPIFKMQTDASFSFFIRRNNAPTQNGGIISRDSGAYSPGWSFMDDSSAGNGRISFKTNNETFTIAGVLPPADFTNFYHVAVSKEAGVWSTYINGVLSTALALGNPTFLEGYDLVIGRNSFVSQRYINMDMYNIGFWNRVLTPSEILAQSISKIYDYTNIAAFWRCDEGSGTTMIDSSGNGRDGTITTDNIGIFHSAF